jgi:hypothetical protein
MRRFQMVCFCSFNSAAETTVRCCNEHRMLATQFLRSEDTFVREWALFAMRNMCEVSTEAQTRIRCASN